MGTLASDVKESGKRLALAIGVNEVPKSHLPSLQHAVADAQAMAAVLEQYCPRDAQRADAGKQLAKKKREASGGQSD